MKRFYKSLLLFICFTIFASILTGHAYASSSSPPPGSVDETTQTVAITIDNLIPNGHYVICPGIDNGMIKSCENSFRTLGIQADPFLKGIVTAGANGVARIQVCGAGKNVVKTSCNNPTGDYFHSKQTYGITLFNSDDPNRNSPNETSYSIGDIGVYSPRINIDPTSKTTPGGQVRIVIRQDKMRPGGDDRNQYNLIMQNSNGSGSKESSCEPVKDTSSPLPLVVPQPNEVLGAGVYTLLVVGCGKDQSDNYWTSQVNVDVNGGSISTPSAALNFAEDTPEPSPPPLPCEEGIDKNGIKLTVLSTDIPVVQKQKQQQIVTCTKVSTAIGGLSTDPAGFIKSVFSLLLGLSGGIAVILIIISGYRLMTSQGNPEQVQGAREMLTSAIVGLLFIIFSFVILQIIGVNILKIPGFGA